LAHKIESGVKEGL